MGKIYRNEKDKSREMEIILKGSKKYGWIRMTGRRKVTCKRERWSGEMESQ